MISTKFVKIAREVIKFVRDGGRLQRERLSNSKNQNRCPIGVVCLNHNLVGYGPALSFTNLTDEFIWGFDESDDKTSETINNKPDEDYQIGYKLGQQCQKRGWIDSE
mgnify:CR=1 FL=1